MEISSDYLCNRIDFELKILCRCPYPCLRHSFYYVLWLVKKNRVARSNNQHQNWRQCARVSFSAFLIFCFFVFSFLCWVLYNHKMFVAIFFLVLIKSASTIWQLHRTGLQGEYLLVDICINVYYLYFTQNQMIPYRVLADDLP